MTADNAPTFFANIATMHYRGDEVVIEFRRWIEPHREIFEKFGAGKALPAADPKTIYEQEPIARVVLTYHAAKGLYDWLVKSLPVMMKSRKEES